MISKPNERTIDYEFQLTETNLTHPQFNIVQEQLLQWRAKNTIMLLSSRFNINMKANETGIIYKQNVIKALLAKEQQLSPKSMLSFSIKPQTHNHKSYGSLEMTDESRSNSVPKSPLQYWQKNKLIFESLQYFYNK